MAQPRTWSPAELAEDAGAAKGRFRRTRLNEPLERYTRFFDAFTPIFTDLIDRLPSLADEENIRDVMAGLVEDDDVRKRGFQGGALRRPPGLCEEERAMGQADRLEESFAQLVEQRRPPGRVQVDQPVDPREGHRRGVEVAPAGRQLQPRRLDQRRPAAGEGVEYDPVARGAGGQQLFDELRRELPGPGQGIGPHPLGDVEGALGKGGPVQGRGGEGVVQDHGRNEWDAERVRGGEALPARRCLSLMFGSSYSDGGEAEHA